MIMASPDPRSPAAGAKVAAPINPGDLAAATDNSHLHNSSVEQDPDRLRGGNREAPTVKLGF